MALPPSLDVLAQRAARNRIRARIQKSPSHQLLGSRARHVAVARSLLVVHPLPDDDQARIRSDGQAPQLHRTRRRNQRFRGEQAIAPAHRRAARNSRDKIRAIARRCSISGVKLSDACPSQFTSRRSTLAPTRCAFRSRAHIPLSTSNLCTANATRCASARSVFLRHRFTEDLIQKRREGVPSLQGSDGRIRRHALSRGGDQRFA